MAKGSLFRFKIILTIALLCFSSCFIIIFSYRHLWARRFEFSLDLARHLHTFGITSNYSNLIPDLDKKQPIMNQKKLKGYLYPPPIKIIDLKIRYLVNNDVCSTFPLTEDGRRDKAKDVLIINLLISHAGNSKLRSFIRSSLPKSELERLGVRRLFLLARPNNWNTKLWKYDKNYHQPSLKELLLENEKHGDLLIGDFLDKYKNLTYKSLMGLDWATKYCPRATFILKSDDDTLVDYYQLTTLLRNTISNPNSNSNQPGNPNWSSNSNFGGNHPIDSTDPEDPTSQLVSKVRKRLGPDSSRSNSDRRLITGSVEPQFVKRRFGSKRHVTKEEYPEDEFPAHADGRAYLMTMEAALDLLPSAKSVPFFFLENVYITGFLRKRANVDYLNIKSLYNQDINFMKCCTPHALSNSSDLDLQLEKSIMVKNLEQVKMPNSHGVKNESFNLNSASAFLHPQWCSVLFGTVGKNESDLYGKFYQHAKFCYDSHLCTRRSQIEQWTLCNGIFNSKIIPPSAAVFRRKRTKTSSPSTTQNKNKRDVRIFKRIQM